MTHDHVYPKNSYISRLIRRKAKLLCRRASFSPSDYRDIQQELEFHLHRQQGKFDPRVASFETFADRVITNKACSLIRHSRAQKRCVERESFSLHEDVDGLVDDEKLPRSETIADTTSPAPDRHDLFHDADTMTQKLDEEARNVFELRRRGHSQFRISQQLRISRRRVADAIERIQQEAVELGLHEYIGGDRAITDADGVDHR